MDTNLEILQRWKPLSGVVWLLILLLWETLAPYFDLFRNNPHKRLGHITRNMVLGILNAIMTAFLFAALWSKTAAWSAQNGFGLLHHIPLSSLFHALIALLLLDGWTYLWHRINHRIPFLWRFHRVHHSDPQMDVTTANRFHLGEIFLSSALRIPLIALLGIHFWELVFYETLLLAENQFQHANIGLPARLDQFLRLFIVTPAMHKVHHSRWQPETDSNYSSLLSVWDRIGRTFRLRANPHEIHFGLEDFDADEFQSVPGMLKTPASNASETQVRKEK